ncbi:barstar family protein [Atopococcus tabaci]|uniref:barstar family protein n=1 Tax=Atopococcus tabaci TaxID=269774 RepID=UPI00040AE51C|nr:barstar family protein [Atopococcus tabaci]
MQTIQLDGTHMQTKERLHAYLHAQLPLPGYYGWNLDALYDALTSYDKPLSIMLINKPELLNQLGTYGETFVQTLRDASEVNPQVEFKVI